LDLLKLKFRIRGMEQARYFRRVLASHIARGHKHVCDHDSTNLGCRLLWPHREGILFKKGLHDNLVSTLLAGHENPQLALLSIMYQLGMNPNMQEKVRPEIKSLYLANVPNAFEPPYTEIHNLPFLATIIYETVLGNDIAIPQGVYVGYNAYKMNQDVSFCGKDTDSLNLNAGAQTWKTSIIHSDGPTPRAHSLASTVAEESALGRGGLWKGFTLPWQKS
jgi:cytochrome P450